MSQKDIDSTESRGLDEDFDEAIEALSARERARTIKIAFGSVLALGIVLLGFWWIAENTEDFFRPNLEVADGELAILAETNDPVCRGIIQGVSEAAADWQEREAMVAESILGDDEATLDQIRETATAFRSRMAQIAENIDQAVLREPEARRQMHEWFGHQDNEFGLIERMADRQLRILHGEESAEDAEGIWAEPANLRDQLLLNIDDNYHGFRVWVAAGSHPCGVAPEGVEPWQPPSESGPDEGM